MDENLDLQNLQDQLRNKLINNKKWDTAKHTAAFDCIHDIDTALNAYLEDYGADNIGKQYLYAYGALQCLTVLIQSIETIYQDFQNKEFKKYNENLFDKVIKYRDAAIGHPVITESPPARFTDHSHFIVRQTLSKHGFKLHSMQWLDDTPHLKQNYVALEADIQDVKKKCAEMLKELIRA
jgi:hypothetical protein